MVHLAPLLEVKNLKTYFYAPGKVVPAVDGVSFHVDKGEVLCIVGESGCGKSVTSLSVMRLVPTPPGRFVEGEILFEGEDLLKKTEKEMCSIRGNAISMIYQEPMTSLNPVFTIGMQIVEAIRIHQGLNRKDAEEKAVKMLRLVGIADPASRLKEYPHQLSGGMRQRVMIAMGLCCEPKLLIADEPTTALDVTIQAQILNLLKELQKDMGLTYIFIAHGLNVVKHISDRVGVMYLGRMAEVVEAEDLFHSPAHPYTQALLSAIPHPDPTREQHRIILEGDIPSPVNPPSGCYFHTRCHHCGELCACEVPQMQRIGEREVACHYPLLK